MCTILQLCSGLCLQAFLFSNSLHFCTMPGANQFFFALLPDEFFLKPKNMYLSMYDININLIVMGWKVCLPNLFGEVLTPGT